LGENFLDDIQDWEESLNRQGYGLTDRGIDELYNRNFDIGEPWNPGVPDHPDETTDEPWGLGDWDWETANESDQRGPSGEALPEGAMAWDAWGNPYYGEGVDGYWKALKTRFTGVIEESGGVGGAISELADAWKTEKTLDLSNNKDEQLENLYAGNVEAAQTFIGSLFDTLHNLGGEFGEEAGQDPGVVTLIARSAEEIVRGIITAADQVGKAGKRIAGTTILTLEGLASQSDLPEAGLGFQDKLDSVIAGITGFDEDSWTTELRRLNPLHIAWEGLRAIEAVALGPATLGDAKQEFDDARIASRIFGTVFFDETVKAEYVRRFKAGEPPGLITAALENPMAELAAELAFDPLDYIAPFLKVAKTGKRIEQARVLYNVADDIKPALSVLSDIDKVDDTAKFAAKVTLRDEVIKSVARISTKMDETVETIGLMKDTARGKRALVADRLNPLIGEITRLSGQLPHKDGADGALEVFRSLMNLSSGDVNKVSEGIEYLRHFPQANLLLSPAAQELGLVLNKMTDGGKIPAWFDDFTKMDDVGKLKFVEGKFNDTLESVYPTLSQRIADGGEITPFWRGVDKAHKNAQKVFGPVKKFMGTAWIRYNPGNWFRNWYGNSVAAFSDQGLSSVITPRSKVTSGLKQIFGETLPAGARRTFITPAAEVMDVGKGAKIHPTELIEQIAGEKIYYTEAKRAMSKLVPEATRPLDDLLDYTDQEIGVIKALISEARGDTKAALARYKESSAGGFIRRAETLDMLRTEDLAKLDDVLMGNGIATNMREGIAEVLGEGGSGKLDDVLAKFDELRDEILRVGDEAALHGTPSSIEDGGKVSQVMNEAVDAGDLADDVEMLTDFKRQANNQSFDAWRNAVRDIESEARRFATESGNQEMTAVIDNLRKKYGHVFDDVWRSQAESVAEDVITGARSWSYGPIGTGNRAHKNALLKKHGSLEKMWYSMGIPGDPPELRDLNHLYDVYWQDYITPRLGDVYGEARDANSVMSKSFINDLTEQTKGFKYTVQSNALAEAEQLTIKAQQMQNALIFSKSGIYAGGDAARETTQLMKLAQRYGIPGADDFGKMNSRLLNTIKKHSGKEFADLGQVGFEEGQQALEAWAVSKNKPIIPVIFAEETKTVADIGEEIVSTPRLENISEFVGKPFDEWPPELQEAAKIRAGEMQLQIGDLLKGGSDSFITDPTTGGVTGQLRRRGQGPDWWKNLDKKPSQDKVIEILNEIELGKPPRKSQIYKDLLDEVLGQLEQSPLETEAIEWIKLQPPSLDSEMGASPAQMVAAGKDKYIELMERVKKDYAAAWDEVIEISTTPEKEKQLLEAMKVVEGRMSEARVMTDHVATAARDFALHDYQKTKGIDLALAYLSPFPFWQSRTYPKWFQRIAMNPGTFSAYGHYRNALEKIHAGAPEWWKYNISSNELLGLNSENPLYFNLEATVNPMYGLTGSNFVDPLKRVNGWTAGLDNINKTGVGLHPVWQLATALILSAQGEKEAAARWGGTGIMPQLKSLKAATSLAGVGPPGGVQLDPFVHMFSGGIDPYERRRVGRALYAIIEENPELAAQAFEDARNEEGELWDMALERAATQRAPGQLASFFLGTGFKGRTQADAKIDEYDKARRMLMARSPDLSPEEIRQGWRELRESYPEGDLVVLTRKGGIDRDISYAWSVLNRIPPGQSFDVVQAAGIPDHLVDQFYSDGGRIDKWKKTDQDRFMNGMSDLGALLEIPNDATVQEWNEARRRYDLIKAEASTRWGTDILEKVDAYFGFFSDDPASKERAREYMDAHPEVGEYLDFKSQVVLQDDILQAKMVFQYQLTLPYRHTLPKTDHWSRLIAFRL